MRVGVGFGVLMLAATGTAHGQAVKSGPGDQGKDDARDDREIIVTAIRRDMPIETVPAAVSSYDAEPLDLAGVTDVRRLQQLSSSFNFTSSISDSYGAVIRVRGIGTSGSNPGLEAATGIYIDGVYRSRAGLAVSDIPGLRRIELVRGPQGTLFGRNTTAGVVNIVTDEPAFAPAAGADLSGGNYGFAEMRGFVTAPVSSSVAVRFDVIRQERDGLVKDRIFDRDYYSRHRAQVRGQVLVRASEALSFRLIVDDLERDEAPGNGLVYRVADPQSGAVRALATLGSPPVANFDASDTGRLASMTGGDLFDRGFDRGVSLEGDLRTGIGDLTSISAYRDVLSRRSVDFGGTRLSLLVDPNNWERYRTLTQEVRLAGSRGRASYVMGVFYAHERVQSHNSYAFGSDLEAYLKLLTGTPSFTPYTGLPDGQNFRGSVNDLHTQTSDSLAAFGHLSYDVLPRLSLAAGLRYTREWKSLDSTVETDDPTCSAAVALGGPTLSGDPPGLQGLLCIPNLDSRRDGRYRDSSSSGNWSGTASIEYQVSSTLHAYALASRGYKAGGYNLDRTGLALPVPKGSDLRFGAERSDNLEAGLKERTAGGRFAFTLTGFTTRIDGYQFAYNQVLPSGATQRVTASLPLATTRGIEFEGSARLTSRLSVDVDTTYQDARFGSTGFPAPVLQLQGQTLPNAPRWIATGQVTWEKRLGARTMLTLESDMRWQSSANVSSSATISPLYVQGAYAIVDARARLAHVIWGWSVDVFVRNLFDKAAWTQLLPGTLQSGTVYGYLNEPRLYGVRISWRR
jgi:outer membrane receptor protein involved in Fe transport